MVLYFNPHSPRREWPSSSFRLRSFSCISIHTLLAESDSLLQLLIRHISISIHTLLAESDGCNSASCLCCDNFNPHSPRREWRNVSSYHLYGVRISIHTLLAESDPGPSHPSRSGCYFNPHSPRREWHDALCFFLYLLRFQSTLSSQRVTILHLH